MTLETPFLNVSSFVADETPPPQETIEPARAPASPFLSVYQMEDDGETTDPLAEQQLLFLHELHDEEFDEAIMQLVSEASTLYDNQFSHEQGDQRAADYAAERFLHQHFEPLLRETTAMLANAAADFGSRDPATLTESEVEATIDGYTSSTDLSPGFENFFGKLKKMVKKVVKKGVDLAKKGVKLAATLGLGPILNKLKGLIKPLLKKVLEKAIGKLPPAVQPIARKLAEKLPFLKEMEETSSVESGYSSADIGGIQQEFNERVASLLFAPSEIEQDLEFAEGQSESNGTPGYSLADLDRAREQFVNEISQLRDGEDPTPYVQNFIPAILPALKLGISIVGRKKVVGFLAKFLAKLIGKFVGPQNAPALSQAIVDAGLRLISLEAMPQDESRAAGSAVAATIEDTVRQVAGLPEYVLNDQELLEGFALEAFEDAAAANLPPVLPERVYRKRPNLRQAKGVRGAWIMLPLRGRRKRYKKFSRVMKAKVTPHDAGSIETSDGSPLSEFLEEQFGVEPGEEVDANIHLFETMPGTFAADVARLDQSTPGLGGPDGYQQLHPLTPDAASKLLGEQDLGRDLEPRQMENPYDTDGGQRLYYLEIPAKRALTTPGPNGRSKIRRRTRVSLKLDFPGNQIVIRMYLSEKRAQELALKLRQQAHLGFAMTQLQGVLERGLRGALSRGFGRLKIIHEAALPGRLLGALQRLPAFVPQVLKGRLIEWAIKGLEGYLKQQAQQFIAATEDAADGVTVAITIANPPGFAQLRDALKGKALSLRSLKSIGTPDVKLKVTPGYANE